MLKATKELRKPLKTVADGGASWVTGLKPGVNEMVQRVADAVRSMLDVQPRTPWAETSVWPWNYVALVHALEQIGRAHV